MPIAIWARRGAFLNLAPIAPTDRTGPSSAISICIAGGLKSRRSILRGSTGLPGKASSLAITPAAGIVERSKSWGNGLVDCAAVDLTLLAAAGQPHTAQIAAIPSTFNTRDLLSFITQETSFAKVGSRFQKPAAPRQQPRLSGQRPEACAISNAIYRWRPAPEPNGWAATGHGNRKRSHPLRARSGNRQLYPNR